MGRGKRFKILETARKKYKATGAAGTPIANYIAYTNGEPGHTITPDQPERGVTQLWLVTPFGVPTTENPYLVNRASTRALVTNLGSSGLSLADLAVAAYSAAVAFNDTPNFIPAKAVIFDPTGATTSPISAITKLEYDRRSGVNYTLPFGQGATPGTTMTAAMGYITGKVRAVGNTATFKPERFYGKGR